MTGGDFSGSPPFDTDVLIVGAGPTGATTALALATHGVRAHMISRSRWLADTPRAHITNQRTMEVFRDLGIGDAVAREASPWDIMGDTLFTTSLAGEELVRLRTWGTGDDRKGDYLRASPCGMADLIQPKLEPILLKNAAERGASFAFNTEYLSHQQDAEGVTVHLRDRAMARDYSMRARYLVGADGARSPIVEELGLPIEGHMARAGSAYVTFEADLTRHVEHRPSILNWIVTPHASFGEIGMGLLRAVRPWTRWMAGWGFDIAQGKPDLSDEAMLREKIVTMIGDPTIEVTIERTAIWYVNQAHATRYASGRVFCGGDAVHRHPPSSGLGMNTCVQDGFNLGWKLAYVIKGHAGPALLDSYSDERAPVGKQIVLRANQSRLDYAPLNACFRVAGAANPVAAGIARFRDPGPDGVAARLAVEKALDLKNSEFNAQGVEMNQRYASSAVIGDDAAPETWARDPDLYCQPTTRPGAKLPHAWLVDRAGMRVSTLDLTGGGAFTLITGLAGTTWTEAAAKLDLPYLRTIVTGSPDAKDVYCEWQRVREIAEGGALLVRPDGYIAWRAQDAIHDPAEACATLAAALGAILDAPIEVRVQPSRSAATTMNGVATKAKIAP